MEMDAKIANYKKTQIISELPLWTKISDVLIWLQDSLVCHKYSVEIADISSH